MMVRDGALVGMTDALLGQREGALGRRRICDIQIAHAVQHAAEQVHRNHEHGHRAAQGARQYKAKSDGRKWHSAIPMDW